MESTFEHFKAKALQSKRVDTEVLDDLNELLLEDLRLIENGYLKRAGILLFHPQPERFFLGAFVKIDFFRTDDDLVFQDEVHGNLFEQIEKSWDLLTTKYSTSQISYSQLFRIEPNPFPQQAIREALLNAIAHKDYSQTSPIQISVYSDHIIFWNEGSLPENWTTEQLRHKHPSKPFNPDIANAFFRSGYIESWGRGTLKMIKECIDAGILPPSFNYDFSGFMVEFYSNAIKYLESKGLPNHLINILVDVIKIKETTNSIVQKLCGVSKATATRYLNELEGEYLDRKGDTGRGTYYTFKGLNKGS